MTRGSVYHFKPLDMTGNVLFPLNRLRETHPEIYSKAATKYVGRESLMSEVIPGLNCLWNDVLHLSPIHPQRIVDCWKQHGLIEHTRISERKIEVYEIPVELLLENNTVYFQSQNTTFGDFSKSGDKYWAFKQGSYREQMDVEKTQIEVWQRDHQAGRRFLWYSHTTHILAQQNVDISECKTTLLV
jgi:hypothetical protein